MNRFIGPISVILILFVLVLGLRNRLLDHSPLPKRKGKAVISCSTIKFDASSRQQTHRDNPPPAPVALPLSIAVALILFAGIVPLTHDPSLPSYALPPLRSNRAPPSFA